MINYKFKIDCQGEKILASDITFVTGDVGAYKLTFDFFDNGKKADISNYILTIRAKRADGKIISGTGEIVNNSGVFVPQNSIYAVPGEVLMEVALCDSAKNYITTKIITAEVIQGLGEDGEPEANEISAFVSLISRVQEKVEATQKLIEASVPQREVDYWTEEDKEEIKTYVDEAILGGAW